MKHIRSKLALTLCLALSACGASTALAASDKAPSFKMAAPGEGVTSGGRGTLTVETKTPGFLTVALLDDSGDEVTTLFSFKEIHTSSNEIDFVAVDTEGEPIPAGDYTLSATMESQFGVSSDTVTASLTVSKAEPVALSEDDPDEDAKDEEEASSSKSKKTSSKKSKDADSSEDAETAEDAESVEDAETAGDEESAGDEEDAGDEESARDEDSSKGTSSSGADVSYGSGSADFGDEGLQIGVGVDDTAEQTDAGYWALSADASDADIWAAITRELVGVDVGENESAYIYDSVDKDRNRLGTVSGISQGLNVVAEREDGWSLVEAFRNEDGAFVRGYIRTNKLRRVTPNATYGLVIDKQEQTLTVYKEGERIGSCQVTTGLPTEKYLQRETPAGEFITVTRRGTIEYYGKGFTKYTIRINGGYYLCEIPTTKKNGSNFSLLEDSLGEKATRGNVCIAHEASSDGGINAEWIWDMTDKNKKVKVLIFDDKDRSEVPIGE